MAKVSFSSLKLKANTEVKTIDYNNITIEVSQYLSVNDKYDLINVVLQNSLEEGIYNSMRMDMYFHLYLVFMYTNLTFTEKQKEDASKLYDLLKGNGLMDTIISAIPELEYETLYTYLEDMEKRFTKYRGTFTSFLQSVIADLPTQAEAAAQIVNDFDPEKFKNVIDFAKAANGGRNI